SPSLFDAYVPLQYHLSFPTRRSSDLDLQLRFSILGSGNHDQAVSIDVRKLQVFQQEVEQRADANSLKALADRSIGAERRLFEILDRKSTRLNSSHEWISYAVFCLKKK